MVVLLSDNLLLSQNRFELSGGFGMPEYINLKIKYGGRFKIGVGIGTFPETRSGNYFKPQTSRVTPLSVDFYYHYARSKDTDLFKWYLNSGITYLNVPSEKEKNLAYCFKAGRTINFSKRTGINIDLGFLVLEYWRDELIDHRNSALGSNVHHEVNIPMPIGSLSFFVKV